MNESNLLSPEVRTCQRQNKLNADRIRRSKESLLNWSLALVIIFAETFLFKGYFASWILPFLPSYVIYYAECSIAVYIIAAIIFLTFSMVFGTPNFLTSVIPLVSAPRPKPNQPNLNESRGANRSTLERSWVEDVNFGTPSEKSFNNSLNATKSPTTFNTTTTSILAGYINSPIARSTPNAKPVDSIHTREQLDRFLRKEAENSFLDMSSSSLQNNSFTYFNMLDLAGERKGYQVSDNSVIENKENSSILRLPTDRRVHLNPLGAAENDVEALSQLRTALLAAKEIKKAGSPMLRRDSVFDRSRRRSSHSSPTPQLGAHSVGDSESGGIVDDIDLSRAELKLRSWIVRSILMPLRDQIRKVNSDLEKEHANPPLRIGVSSVEALKTALTSRESLRTTQLAFVLPFLHAHSNQGYLVSRIGELSADTFMVCYNWNGGGCEPEEKTISINSRTVRKRWHEGLPTDAELIFTLFCTFMDYQLTSTPIVGSLSLDQPFSAIYSLTAPNKPTAAHCAGGSFYLHMNSKSPPHIDFVYVTEGGRIPMKTSVTKGSINLFQAILHFVHHAKTQNAGKIDMISVGRTGLGIAQVLE